MPTSTPEPDRKTLPFALAWTLAGLAVLGGAWLRLYALTNQVVLDDEYHAINVALHHPYGAILSRFFGADNSIPLTAIYKFLMDSVGLSELGLRLPQVVCGILLLMTYPFWVRRIAGWPETLLFLVLTAMSPQLIFYSRYARPYAVSTFAAGLAVGAFLLFARTGRGRWLVPYVVGGILAAWFQPLSLPFVLAPVLFFVMTRRWLDQSVGASVTRAIVAGGAVLVTVALLFTGPALTSLDRLTGKAGQANFSMDSFRRAGWLWSGALSGWVAGLFWILAIVGAVILVRRHRLEGGCLAFCALVQAIAILVASPTLADHFYILARYNLWSLPLVLLFVAVGSCGLFRGRWRWLGLSSALLLAGSSPLWATYRMPNNFTNQQRYQLEFVFPGYSQSRDRQLLERASTVYQWLAEQPPDTMVVETPWYHYNSAVFYGNLQHRHRKAVLIGILDQKVQGWLPLSDSRLRFRNFLPATDVPQLRARGVDYLIVHQDLMAETAELGFLLPDVSAHDLTQPTRVWLEELGPPIREDRWIQVYAVRPTPPLSP